MFIYPDRPGLVMYLQYLKDSMPGYICQLKIDGWRCVVSKEPGQNPTYTSRSCLPIAIPDAVRIPFETTMANAFGQSYCLDCELTGKRREGDADGIFVLECLRIGGIEYRLMTCIDRLMAATRAGDYAVPWTNKEFHKFIEHHRSHTPLAEGVVLKQENGLLHNGLNKCAKNNTWIKIKWRAGEDGLSPTEIE